MKINSQLIKIIKTHEYLKIGGCDFMKLDKCRYSYQLIEKILVNIAAKNRLNWKDLTNIYAHNDEIFVELCVAIILINKYMNKYFNIENGESLIYTRYDFTKMIRLYKNTQTN